MIRYLWENILQYFTLSLMSNLIYFESSICEIPLKGCHIMHITIIVFIHDVEDFMNYAIDKAN